MQKLRFLFIHELVQVLKCALFHSDVHKLDLLLNDVTVLWMAHFLNIRVSKELELKLAIGQCVTVHFHIRKKLLRKFK